MPAPVRPALPAAAMAALILGMLAAPAHAGGPDKWSTVDDIAITESNRPSLASTAAGVTVVWTRAEQTPATLMGRDFSPLGASGGKRTIISTAQRWDTLSPDPVALGTQVAVSGVRGTTGTPGFWPGAALLVGPTGSAMGALSAGESAFAGDLAATSVGGTPVTVFTDVSSSDRAGISMHVGTVAGQDTPLSAGGGCCSFRPGIAADTASSAWVAWYSTQPGSARGWVARRATGLPGFSALSGMYVAPGGTVAGDTVAPTQRAAIAARPGGSAWLAYPLESVGARRIRVWQLGTSTYLDIRVGTKAEQVSLSADRNGRLWVAYLRPRKKDMAVVRSDPTVSRFGQPDIRPLPRGYAISTAVEAWAGRRADVVINSGTVLRHRQFLPLLTASAKVEGVNSRQVRVRVTVREAGGPVRGATVTAAGKRAITDAAGVARLEISKRSSVRLAVTKMDYRSDRLLVSAR